ncbi:MAG: hypothetical protein KC416_04195 [Myxococcales bacterium]|nr:hypothetical protein [Myxococcales bacterium]
MRLKIIAGNLFVILAVGLTAFFMVRDRLQEELPSAVRGRIGSDALLITRSWRMAAHEFTGQVADRAASDQVRDSMGSVGSALRNRVYDVANDVADWFADPARGRQGPPHIVVITNSAGEVIARNQDRNRLHGTFLGKQVPALKKVLAEGGVMHDVWLKKDEGKYLSIAVSAIVNRQNAVVGALLVGYDVSAALAKRESDLLGREVAFLVDSEIYSASMTQETRDGLNAFLYGAQASQTEAALAGKPSAGEWEATFAGSDWVGVTAPLTMAPSTKIAVAVVGNLSEAASPASVSNLVLILTVLGALLVLVYGFIIGTSFLKPLEEIEEGVLAVINGNTALRIDVDSPEFGGLAYRINQLINVFLGVSETDDDGRVSEVAGAGGWSGEFAASGGGQGAPASEGGGGPGGVIEDEALAAQLESEPEEAYLERIYQEYVAAKTAAGEDVSNIPKDRFVQRLQRNAESLQKKNDCRMVRFVVEGQGNLKPVIIR